MTDLPEATDAISALRNLKLDEVEARLTDLDSERAQLSLLRRSLLARERARRKAEQRGRSTQ